MDLPSIGAGLASDLKIDIFAIDDDTNLTSFHICNAHEDSGARGSNVAFLTDHPYFEEETKEDYPSVNQRVSILVQDAHTSSTESEGDDNKITFEFTSVFLNIPEESVNDKEYYIAAGVNYGDGEYVWIGQVKVVADIQPNTVVN